jgi:hypothetical protein
MSDEEEVQEESVLEEVAGMYAEESKAMLVYIRDSYSEKVKPPKPPEDKDLTFFALAGFETISFSVPAFAMALFSAVRTGQFFYVLELLMLSQYNLITGYLANSLAFAVMVLSLFGFEGYILARGIKNGRKKVVLAGDNVEVESNGLATALSFLVILSIAIFSGTELIDDLSSVFIRNMNIYMVFITGLASTVLVFFGGDDIGIASESYTVKKRRLLSKHSKDYQEWWEGAVRSWVGVKASYSKKGKGSNKNTPVKQPSTNTPVMSSDWRSVKLELTPEQMYELANMDLSDVSRKEALAKSFNVVTKTIENWSGQAQKIVGDWVAIEEHIEKTGAFPTSDEMRNMKLSGKNVSMYIINNSKDLLDNNLIPDAYIQKANDTLNKKE